MMRVGRAYIAAALLALTGCVSQPGDIVMPTDAQEGAAWNAKFQPQRFVLGARSYAVHLSPVDLMQAQASKGLINQPLKSALVLAVSRADGDDFANTVNDRREAERVANAYCRHLGFVEARQSVATFVPAQKAGGASEWSFPNRCTPPSSLVEGRP